MRKVEGGTIISLLLAIICWLTEIITYPSAFEIGFVLFAVFFFLLFVCLLCVSIVKRISKNISPYRVFAITDSIIGIGAFSYAIYDIVTDTSEFFSGLIGMLLLFYVIPPVLILLILDYIAYRKRV